MFGGGEGILLCSFRCYRAASMSLLSVSDHLVIVVRSQMIFVRLMYTVMQRRTAEDSSDGGSSLQYPTIMIVILLDMRYDFICQPHRNIIAELGTGMCTRTSTGLDEGTSWFS